MARNRPTMPQYMSDRPMRVRFQAEVGVMDRSSSPGPKRPRPGGSSKFDRSQLGKRSVISSDPGGNAGGAGHAAAGRALGGPAAMFSAGGALLSGTDT